MTGDRDAVKKSRPTLADIARVVDVSEATVSRALRGNPEISGLMRSRIAGVAREMGYVPNAAARNLARQASRTLGLVVPDMTDPIHGLIFAGFGRAAYARGYNVMVLDGVRDAARREAGLRTLVEYQAQGIAFCSAPIPAREAAANLRPAHAVFIMHEGPDTEADGLGPLGRIRSDEADGIRQLVEHLVSSGRSRLSYANGPDSASNRLRRGAVIRALEELGIEPRIREYATSLDAGQLGSVGVLVARERPEALICYDDKMALHLLDTLRSQGLRVPEDVAVTGFDGIPFAAIANPRLTTVEQPAEALGEAAAEALCEAIENGTPPPDLTFPIKLTIRESTQRG